LVGIEAKQARPRIAWLGPWRHATRLDETEPEPEQRIRHLGVLIKAGSKPDRIREREAERLHAQLFVVGRQWRKRRKLERMQRQRVRGLGIELAQQRADQSIEQRDQGSISGNSCRPS